MNIAHDDLIECVERNRAVVEAKLLSHEDIARHTAEYLARGGRIDHPVSEPIRAETVTRADGGEHQRWAVDTRRQTPRGDGLTAWRGKGRMTLPGSHTGPRPGTAPEPSVMSRERAVARRAGETFYHTGKPCGRGHIDLRYTISGTCRQCHADRKLRAKVGASYSDIPNRSRAA